MTDIMSEIPAPQKSSGADGLSRPISAGRRWAWLALLLCLTQAMLLAHTAWDKSDTVDEQIYLNAAVRLWAHRDFHYNCESPVLPKWGFALALRTANPSIANAGKAWNFWEMPIEEARRALFAARLTSILAMMGGGLLLWRAASRFGPGAGLLTQALWVFSPTVLANGSLATLDGWSAALMCGVIWTTMRMLERAGPWRAAVVGVFCAGAAACKVTALGIVPVVLAVMGWAAAHDTPGPATSGRNGVAWNMLALLGSLFMVLWALYGFTVGVVETREPCAWSPQLAPATVGPVPFPAWFEGILFQLRQGREGHIGYLFGEVKKTGWWWFYLACLALKITVGAQCLFLLRCAATLARRPPASALRIDAALLAYPVLLLVALSIGKHQANIMMLLAAFPFAMIWMGRGIVDVHRAFGAVGRALVLGFFLLGMVEALRVHPHYLMFFNIWAGGPTGGPRYLIHREDWGQDVRELAEWQRRQGIERLYYSTNFKFLKPERWGVVFEEAPCEPRPGVYALHADAVHRPRGDKIKRSCLDWLTIEPPDERIGYSIYIYRVDEARIARLRGERDTLTPFWRRVPHAMPE